VSPVTFQRKQPLTVPLILEWADLHQQRTGRWPNRKSGPVPDTEGETWCAIDQALYQGIRGMPGGETIAQFLARHRGVPNRADSSPLTETHILRLADAYRAGHGDWPNRRSGAVAGAAGLTWSAVDAALRVGARGLPGSSSLARLLTEGRGARNFSSTPKLTEEQILRWADAHRDRMGTWPHLNSGTVLGAEDETWNAVDRALRRGGRGLPGGSSLARLLAAERHVRNRGGLPRLLESQIRVWARDHLARTGEWPRPDSGPVAGAVGETWKGINAALKQGRRGLAGGMSLAKLLAGETQEGGHEPGGPKGFGLAPKGFGRTALSESSVPHGGR
jgi:hypothetical protein